MLKPGKYSCPCHQEESVVLCAQLLQFKFTYEVDHEDEILAAGLHIKVTQLKGYTSYN